MAFLKAFPTLTLSIYNGMFLVINMQSKQERDHKTEKVLIN